MAAQFPDDLLPICDTNNQPLDMNKTLTAFIMALTTLLLVQCQSPEPSGMVDIPLSEGWEFRQADQGEWLAATVPGTVHTDLMAHGVIRDPYFRLNEHDVQWIDKVGWEYRTSFRAGKELLGKDRIVLSFKGLDTYATVRLNGVVVLEADNMFRSWEADVKKVLQEGENELHLLFKSPIAEGIKKYDACEYRIPVSGNDLAEIGQVEGGKQVSVFTRKAGYHFGWDWGPRLVTSGIWRPVTLRAWNGARILDVRYVQQEVTGEKAVFSAVFEMEAERESEAELTVVNEGRILARETVRLTPGISFHPVGFEIPEPRLWWTNGLGEAHLYTISAEMTSGTSHESLTNRIGIRTLEFVREKDSLGTSFSFRLNGVPVFMKGVNYIPNDLFLPRVTPDRYRRVIETAVNSNMNMLRIWGGGIYEEDLLYDLCDEAGILVWQDFMFACAMFPGDSAFLENVRQEAVYNVKRLRNHPSLAVWCGNNENLVAWHNWGWKRAEEMKDPVVAAKIWKGYTDLFHQLLPGIIRELDPQRGYVDSSPSSGMGIVPDLVNGDEHYWGVWWGKEPFETYALHIARFMSEYGFQSFPEIATVRKYALPEDYDIESEVMKSHQRSSIGNGTIEYYMLKEYEPPKDFESFLYVSQVLQAEGIKFGLEGHRRAAPFCMGSLYWQINDVWPVASWSSTDYYQRWKALQYYVKKAFEPVLVSPFLEDSLLKVALINDFLQERQGTLRLTLSGFDGTPYNRHESFVTLPANSSRVLFSENLSRFLAGADPSTLFLLAEYLEEGQVVSSNLLWLLPFKELKLPVPRVEHTITQSGKGFEIRLSSATLARNLYLQIGDEEGFFSDNYFDLLPGKPVTIHLAASLSRQKLGEVLTIRTLDSCFSEK